MKDVSLLLDALKSSGIIREYALFGAVAQMRYTEPVATLDADVLVILPDEARLDTLSSIYQFCRDRGYLPQGEAIQVGDWPLQIIPVFSPLTEEAVREAEVDVIAGQRLRVVSALHLAVIALSVGRTKDHGRVLALLEAGAVQLEDVRGLAARHGLADKWEKFQRRFLDD